MVSTPCLELLCECPSVYRWTPAETEASLLAVVCAELKDEPFPDAACFMQELMGVCVKDWHREAWDVEYAQREGGDLQQLACALTAMEAEQQQSFYYFDICTVKEGQFAGTRALAIGSNVKKRDRAGSLALALTVACARPWESVSGACFPRLVSTICGAESRRRAAAVAPRTEVSVQDLPVQEAPDVSGRASSPSPALPAALQHKKANKITRTPASSAEAGKSAEGEEEGDNGSEDEEVLFRQNMTHS
eukprot:TRINITY_DN48698_c0_g1_i1.p1 TRINITY_DN48698_c0_g1~~TRINITY_DN48698_c0_g1_i1.p1  ORF type:complete len:248 (+),score=58.77 TRINITY_DN48698_c0_g1_i1:53-796(+)